MKLSEAIRLGAMSLPQGFGASSLRCRESRCALGAAALAVGLECADENPELLNALGRRWQLLYAPAVYPLAVMPVPTKGVCVMDVIWRLNDCEQWTREQIADWVESIEQQQDMRAGDKGESLAGTPDAKGPEPTRTAAGEVRFESEAPAPVRVEA